MYTDDVPVTATQYEILRNLIRGDRLIYQPGSWGALVRKGFIVTAGDHITVTAKGWRAFNEATDVLKKLLSYVNNNPECELPYGGVLVPRATSNVKVLRDLGYFEGNRIFRKTNKFDKTVNSRAFYRRKFL